MVHKHLSIPIVVERLVHESDTCVSVYFKRPHDFDFDAGDWVDINFPEGNSSGGITYSLASSPTEEDLMITFKNGISPFKQKLQGLIPVEELYISQYGNDYNFQLKQHRSSVLIAGGIGIAPFRSMIKEMADTENKNDVHLIYMSKDIPFLFADEIDQWQAKLANLKVTYINTQELNRKKREKLLIETINVDAHHFYIAGPEAMVESTEHLMIDQMGITARDIRIDSFGGY